MRFHAKHPPQTVVRIASALDFTFSAARGFRRAVRGCATIGRFGSHGDHFNFDPDGTYSYGTIHVGDHVNLGMGATLLATRSEIRIGNHVMFGPGVTVRGGNHRFDIVGRYIDTIGDDEKRPEDDLGVAIEDDVWVGGNATILGGVRIGTGSIVAASAVVTKDVPPHTLVGGNPARILRERFTPEDLAAHKRALSRLTRTQK